VYEKSKEIIESNRAILDKVGELKTKSNDLAVKLKKIEKDYVEAYSRKVSVTDQIKNIEEQVKKIAEYENELASYQYYLTAIGKDGVPYRIISDAIPKIEQEVNNILSHIVEFTMGIETDGKNVNVYIKYEEKKWPLELCSGMEKFISGLALRVALINVSNLPRPNFLVVDEGFSALDATNIPMMHSLFDYMKTNFEFIIIISHLDAMRDMVDKQLEIKKENGFSKIDNTV
jgi:DNA repair exonuclease SbcCD ATPase subunit